MCASCGVSILTSLLIQYYYYMILLLSLINKGGDVKIQLNVKTRTGNILQMKAYMLQSTFGIYGVLLGFGLVLSKFYLTSSFAYGITLVVLTASTMLSAQFQILAATLGKFALHVYTMGSFRCCYLALGFFAWCC